MSQQSPEGISPAEDFAAQEGEKGLHDAMARIEALAADLPDADSDKSASQEDTEVDGQDLSETELLEREIALIDRASELVNELKNSQDKQVKQEVGRILKSIKASVEMNDKTFSAATFDNATAEDLRKLKTRNNIAHLRGHIDSLEREARLNASGALQ